MKTAVLMSTYNGEEFLNEQIESIVNQTFTEWDLYIRDDGSSDKTLDIIRKWTSKDNRIHEFKTENNVGVVNSFMNLIDGVEADYYFLSDQDDIWHSSKIEDTLNVLKKETKNNPDIPILVHCNLQAVNGDNTKILNPSVRDEKVSTEFKDLLMENNVTGCATAFNLKTRDYFLEVNVKDIKNIMMHDWWLALIASGIGKVCYLNKVEISYRQHGNNVLGANEKRTFSEKLLRYFNGENSYKKSKKNIKRCFKQMSSFKFYYFNDLDKYNQRIISLYSSTSKIKTLVGFMKYRINGFSVLYKIRLGRYILTDNNK